MWYSLNYTRQHGSIDSREEYSWHYAQKGSSWLQPPPVSLSRLDSCWLAWAPSGCRKMKTSLWTCWQSYLQQHTLSDWLLVGPVSSTTTSVSSITLEVTAYWWSRAKHVRLDLFIVGGVYVDEMRLWEAGCFYDLDLRSVQLQSSLSWKVSLILLTSSCLGSPFPILTHCLMRKNRPAATCECKNSGQNVTCNDNS